MGNGYLYLFQVIITKVDFKKKTSSVKNWFVPMLAHLAIILKTKVHSVMSPTEGISGKGP